MKQLRERPQGVAREAVLRLRDSPYHALKAVTCEFRDGVLTLGGRLSSYYFKQMAQEAVASLAGVVTVDNRIEVAPADEETQDDGRP